MVPSLGDEHTVVKCKVVSGTLINSTSYPSSLIKVERKSAPSLFVLVEIPTRYLSSKNITSPPSNLAPLGIRMISVKLLIWSITACCSPSLVGCPMFGIIALPSTITAVSSTKQLSGKLGSSGKTVTSVPCALRAVTYAL